MEKFPEPRKMLDKLIQDGRKLVTIIDPHTKTDDEYFVYQNMKKLGIAVKNKDGNDYISECWPKESVWFDYLNPKTTEYMK